MNLRPRFILLLCALFLLAAPLAWWATHRVAENIVAQWARAYTRNQLAHERAHLRPVYEQIAQVRALAANPAIREWAAHPENLELRRRAVATLRRSPAVFPEHSYFIASHKTQALYYIPPSPAAAARRFHLKPGSPKDRWYFDLLVGSGAGTRLSIHPDPIRGVDHLWIATVIKKGEFALGVTGTATEFAQLLKRVSGPLLPGFSTGFLDGEGRVLPGQPALGDTFVSAPADRAGAFLRSLMRRAKTADGHLASAFLATADKNLLLSVAYLPRLDWYQVNLLDLGALLPDKQFVILGLAFFGLLIATLSLVYVGLSRWVIIPLRRLDHNIGIVQAGRLPDPLAVRNGEIGRLARHFETTAHTLLETNRRLEAKVKERTRALERLSKLDPLTELLNRRGMQARLDEALARYRRDARPFALLWLDLDEFKGLNDRFGHDVGDRALRQIAALITQELRSYDVASRWGGDEFAILLSRADREEMDRVGRRLNECIAGSRLALRNGDSIALSVSIGGCLVRPGDTLGEVLKKADEALYAAKAAGRGCYRHAENT